MTMATDLLVQTPADVEAELPALTAWARDLKVTTADEFTSAGEQLKGIKGAMKRVVDFFRPTKQAQDEAKRRILEAERKLLDPLTEAETLAKRAMLSFQQAEQKRADDERRRLQAEADERARREREALEKKAAAAKKPETKEKYIEAAAAVAPAPVVHVATVAPKVAGVATKKVWTFQITDAALVPRDFLTIDEKKLGQYARAMKEGANVAGVRFYAEESLSSKGY
jgi:hypothetical protein